ncbi:hypothetical protein GCM10011376_33330 [Nocardioides flavus (ex Wang et al. 2016)]|uniref:WD40 repeat domain-containing protein n=1 Tax=Nocardioides flavus (ex Wang et al. 2016) TaxID=2058780 RepID=A0ABQ3HPA4_9ACTN|nr:hypothetical protein [Nocardioides flavus (ex Wang et al. 2016)]GHE18723.1 hypothetical protein GCM10011376_33330 [Nocardioides flavus (ex Wang et al. 2016)]
MTAPAGDVADRLERLAVLAPGDGIDPDAVWTRGRRRQRVRLGAALTAVAAVGLLGTTATPLLVERAQQVEPAGADPRMVLPDVIRQPGGWEPQFPGTPGRLSAVGVGTRAGLWSDRNAWWGVSAATGESRFLDLPGALELSPAALSDDGSHVAYWIATTADADALGPSGDGMALADGVAVLDLETGERETWTIESEHGLWIGGLAWAGDVLWWSAGSARLLEKDAIGARQRTRTWDLGTGERDDSPGSAQRVTANGVGDAPGGFVELRGSQRLTVVSGAVPTTVRLTLPDDAPAGAGTTDPTVSTDGSLVATLLMPDASTYDESPKPVVVGDLGSGEITLRRVGGVSAQSVLGWRSPSEVLVGGLDDVGEGRPRQVNRVWTLDVATGEREALLELSGNFPDVAAEAWTADVVAAPDAPFAPDPRLVGLGLVVATFAAWRVVVRARGRRERA